MKTYFYNRTAYSFLGTEVPQCFEDLDTHFDTRFTNIAASVTHPSAASAENLCRRMADVELYASFISNAQKNPDKFKGATLIGTLLVGYFSACKSLLDAAAVSLSKLYQLPVGNKQMDFSKESFWRAFEQRAPQRYLQYKSLRPLFNQIIDWRDAAIHRITPLVLAQGPGHPAQIPPEKMEIKMIAEPNAEVVSLVRAERKPAWVEPLHFHHKWQPQLIELCGLVCSDIKANT